MFENDTWIKKDHYKYLKSYYDYDCKLTPEGSESMYDVYGAYIKDEWSLYPCAHVIIKEMDEKRARIHQKLSTMWNPYRANVLAVHGFNDCYVAITEYASGKKLTECYRNIDLNTAITICIMLCESLSDVHKVNIIHKDIKPDNIIISNDYSKVKLIDFGSSREFFKNEFQNTEIVGTANYAAPEVVGIKQVDARADIFSLGCILNFMLTGQPPRKKMYTEISYISKIIKKATAEARENRYKTVEQLKKALILAKRNNKNVLYKFLRFIPGFRSMTLWKSIIASMFYGVLIREIIVVGMDGNYLGIILIICFCAVFPIIIAFNIGDVLRLIPIRFRTKSWVIIIIKLILIAFSVGIALLLLTN